MRKLALTAARPRPRAPTPGYPRTAGAALVTLALGGCNGMIELAPGEIDPFAPTHSTGGSVMQSGGPAGGAAAPFGGGPGQTPPTDVGGSGAGGASATGGIASATGGYYGNPAGGAPMPYNLGGTGNQPSEGGAAGTCATDDAGTAAGAPSLPQPIGDIARAFELEESNPAASPGVEPRHGAYAVRRSPV
jgi:hypothetical protein